MEEQIKLSRKAQWQTLRRLLGYLKHLKLAIVWALITLILATSADLASPIILKQIIDNHLKVGNFELNEIAFLIGLFFVLSLLLSLFRYLYTYQFFAIGNKVTQLIRVELFSKLQGMGMRYFDQTPAGSLVSRVTNDTDAIQDMLVSVVSVVFSSILMITLIIGTMFYFNVALALISMAFLPFIFLVLRLYQKYSTKYYALAREKLSQLNRKLAESISGMGIIQIFNQEERTIGEFQTTSQEYLASQMKNLRLNGILLYPVIHLLTALTLASVLIYSGIASFTGAITAGLVMLFVDYIYRLYEPIFNVMDRLEIYQQAIVSSARVFNILDHPGIAPQPTANANAKITQAKIEFKHVTFAYDEKNPVLKDISFVVNPGETVALVGHTGSGKSSIINVIMRFYEFQSGQVLIDDQDIRSFPMAELRQKMSLVLQDPFIYFGSIADNIRLLNQAITLEEVEAACEFVQADSFINQLPNTYDHQVVERGAAFSTGQKQLLAFARTIVTDPRILILDEATANIDSETEALIQAGLAKMRQGRTTIAIAHRLSTIKDANQILVIKAGEIIERGTHEQLLALKGNYYQMYELQKQEMDVESKAPLKKETIDLSELDQDSYN